MGTPSSEEEERILKDLPPFLSDAMNYAKGMGDPRVIKTHLPVAMLNPDIFENSKGKWHRALSKMNSCHLFIDANYKLQLSMSAATRRIRAPRISITVRILPTDNWMTLKSLPTVSRRERCCMETIGITSR